MAMRDYLVGEVTEEYGEGLLSRREALRRLGLLGVGVASASALLAACGASGRAEPAHSPTAVPTPPQATPPPGADGPIRYSANGIAYRAAFQAPSGDPQGAVLIVHENKGLTTHFYDLVARFAARGYSALCVDLLSRAGHDGTAGFTDQAAATAQLAATPVDQLIADLHAGADELLRRSNVQNLGAVGFCFGGGMTWNLLQTGPGQEKRLKAAVPFYGPAPATPDFTGSKAAVLAIYGALDARVDATRDAIKQALEKANLRHEIVTYDGADHAFYNDTGPRYNAAAAALATTKLFDWLDEYLAGLTPPPKEEGGGESSGTASPAPVTAHPHDPAG
jgi:carboxymethylenebutenolidase